ncbi:MAG: hypothetical protein ACRDWT_02075 [Jatrophihabitantaceae bacterium]
MPRFVRVALIAAGAVLGVLIAAVVIMAAINGRTVDPTDPINYPHCARASTGQACQSP